MPMAALSCCSFNPSESMDLVGRTEPPVHNTPSLSFNPSESMDLVGSEISDGGVGRRVIVSILLSQWIWLKDCFDGTLIVKELRFNPSESMDLVGRRPVQYFLNFANLSFNPSESMDLVGRICGITSHSGLRMFQSF